MCSCAGQEALALLHVVGPAALIVPLHRRFAGMMYLYKSMRSCTHVAAQLESSVQTSVPPLAETLHTYEGMSDTYRELASLTLSPADLQVGVEFMFWRGWAVGVGCASGCLIPFDSGGQAALQELGSMGALAAMPTSFWHVFVALQAELDKAKAEADAEQQQGGCWDSREGVLQGSLT